MLKIQIFLRTLVAGLCLFAPLSHAQTQVNKPSEQALQWGEVAVNTFLTAELLSLDEQYESAASTLMPLARYLKDPVLFERVVQWAMQAKRTDLAYSAALQWEQTDPSSAQAKQLADTLLIVSDRYVPLTTRLTNRYAKVLASPSALDLAFFQNAGRSLGLNATQNTELYNALLAGLKAHAAQGEVQYTLARLAYQAKLPKEGAEHVRAASLAQPPSTAAIGALLREDPAQATLSALHWSQRDPKNLDAWRTLGLVYTQLRKPKQAADAFTQGLLLAPKDVPLLLERMDQLRLNGQSALARESLLAAYAVRQSIAQLAPARMLAEQLEEDYHYDKALELYAIAQGLAKEDSDKALLQAKSLALKAKRKDTNSLAALLALSKAINPEDASFVSVQRIIIHTLRDLAQYDQAIALSQTLPSDEVVYEQALSHEMAGQWAKAESMLRDALRRKPNAPHLLNTLGYGLVDRNVSADALKEGTVLLEKALELSPDNAAILDSLGWAYFRNKDYAKAKPLLEKAYDLKRDPEVAAHLGELLWVTGQRAEARKRWTEALSIEPTHKVLNSTLKRLNAK